ncbi:CRISPR-associated helicase Cas3' (plasmid) [Marinivivus vitaminiproducens]|nr:CRISPR-associated helicase Cas3' [Geminicoccaceae bacterium SCSIO 64248]
MDVQDLLLFWGKARPLPGATCSWHPVLWHGLDVAAVGAVLLRSKRPLLKRLSLLMNGEEDQVCNLVTVLLALHDIGKLTRPFQAKVAERWPASVLGPLPSDPPGDPGHGVTGLWLLTTLGERHQFNLLDSWLPSEIDAFLDPFFGHHGRPVAGTRRSATDAALFGRDRSVLNVAAEMVRQVDALLPQNKSLAPPLDGWESATWPLAGLATLADWIGSKQEYFPYTCSAIAPDVYWRDRALPQAMAAVIAAGIEPAQPRPFAGFAALAGGGRSASPLQAWVENAVLPDGPLLVIVEDVTGSGKTEAAMILAQRLMTDGRASGLVMTLPTMATANALFARMELIYRRLFTDDATPSLALAHGSAALNPRFQAAARIAGATPPGDAERGGDAGSAECAAWLADDRRKAFLADVGCATIDQAILAILPAKHQAIRLLGLTERVLVIDEAHAYDAYVTTELEELLAAQANAGGSAIVLSATLPARTRCRMAEAFARGQGRPAPPLHAKDYPMATIVSTTTATEMALEVRPALVRSVRVERLDDDAGALAAIGDAARCGAAVAWIRNTVDDALDAVDRLRTIDVDPVLFHARFAMGDRLTIEGKILAGFGPESTRGSSRVVVATQVIEQSLDLDFDLMVTDLAPVDLLLQRMGRLWRHPARNPHRPISGPRLLVVSPAPVEAPPSDWLSSALPGTSYVYPDHALLWRSARSILGRGEVHIPGDVRELVEEAYDDPAEVPEALARAADQARGKAHGQTWIARTNTLDLTKGYAPGSGEWAVERMIPTRDAEDYLTVRLGGMRGSRIVPWCEDPNPRRAWALSEIKVRRSRAVTAITPAGVRHQSLTSWSSCRSNPQANPPECWPSPWAIPPESAAS